MRYANKLEFAEKTHEVSMTAQRLVQRMKKDSIHSGRRPSGLCGAALLIAARMHEFSRSPSDIVRIVKIHESTLRKRLVEFGETPSSALTLDEFMSVDLEAEQDPPAFKAARKKDKERLQKLAESPAEFNQLQAEIDAALDREVHKAFARKRKLKGEDYDEDEVNETDKFIQESTLDVINECLDEEGEGSKGNGKVKRVVPEGMKPDLMAICANSTEERKENPKAEAREDDGELLMDDLDDDEINGYIMTEEEARYKDLMWNRLHAEYLKEVKEKEERLAKEREEGKPEKKKRKNTRKKAIGPSNSAGEAIEKMLQEKKISSKINYEILKTLTDSSKEPQPETSTASAMVKHESSDIDVLSRTRIKPETALSRRPVANLGATRRNKPTPATLPVVTDATLEDVKPVLVVDPPPATPKMEQAENIDDYDEEADAEPEPEPEHKTLAEMLNTGDDDDYYGYEEDY